MLFISLITLGMPKNRLDHQFMNQSKKRLALNLSCLEYQFHRFSVFKQVSNFQRSYLKQNYTNFVRIYMWPIQVSQWKPTRILFPLSFTNGTFVIIIIDELSKNLISPKVSAIQSCATVRNIVYIIPEQKLNPFHASRSRFRFTVVPNRQN